MAVSPNVCLEFTQRKSIFYHCSWRWFLSLLDVHPCICICSLSHTTVLMFSRPRTCKTRRRPAIYSRQQQTAQGVGGIYRVVILRIYTVVILKPSSSLQVFLCVSFLSFCFLKYPVSWRSDVNICRRTIYSSRPMIPSCWLLMDAKHVDGVYDAGARWAYGFTCSKATKRITARLQTKETLCTIMSNSQYIRLVYRNVCLSPDQHCIGRCVLPTWTVSYSSEDQRPNG